MRLLIVEDEADIAASLHLLLSHSMLRIEVASTGLEGIAKARAFAPDVILLDVRLPGMDGIEVYTALRAELAARDTKVIFLSAHADGESVARANALGGVAWIRKPFRAETLRGTVFGALKLPVEEPQHRSGEPETPVPLPAHAPLLHVALVGADPIDVAHLEEIAREA